MNRRARSVGAVWALMALAGCEQRYTRTHVRNLTGGDVAVRVNGQVHNVRPNDFSVIVSEGVDAQVEVIDMPTTWSSQPTSTSKPNTPGG